MKKTFTPLVLVLIPLLAYPQTGIKNSFLNTSGSKFEENRGQISSHDEEILFVLKSQNMNVFFKKSGIVYQWKYSESLKSHDMAPISEATGQPIEGASENKPESIMQHIFQSSMNWENANKQVRVLGKEQSPGLTHYYTSNTKDDIVDVKTYDKVVYENIYSKIDLQYYIKDAKLKYDIILNPGANLADLQMTYESNVKAQIQNGSIKISSSIGSIEESEPVAFYSNGDPVKIKYARKNPAKNSFSFESESPLDPSRQVTIDPWVSWNTYFGGTGNDFGTSIITDKSDNVYLSGYTESTGLQTSGLTSFATVNDVFIIKFNVLGERVWSTYFGGDGDDRSFSSVSDSQGNIYLTGQTSSSNIGYNGHDLTYGGNIDIFLVKISGNGQRLWATYYGDAGADKGKSISIDPSTSPNNVLITGETNSPSGIATMGQTINGGTGAGYGLNDAFVAKFSSAGALSWGRYYGGYNEDLGTGISVDATGSFVLSGTTSSTTSIATAGTHKTSFNPATEFYNQFAAKFAGDGSVTWGTYYSQGSSTAYGAAVTHDVSGTIFISGTRNIGPTIDAFLSKLTSTGTLAWEKIFNCSTMGVNTSSRNETISNVISDNNGNIYLSGNSGSATFVGKYNIQDINNGLMWVIQGFGGDSQQTSAGLAIDKAGYYYTGGSTTIPGNLSNNKMRWGFTPYPNQGHFLLAESNGMQNTNAGASDAFAMRFYFEDNSYLFMDKKINDIFVDANQNIYTCGFKLFQQTGQPTDAYVEKVNSAGTVLWTSTFFGATSGPTVNKEETHAVAVDGLGNVYIAGDAYFGSTISGSGHQTTHGGGISDGFIAKYNSSGVKLWQTYYGGSGEDRIYDLVLDASNNVFVIGSTTTATANIIATSGGGTYNGGTNDTFVAKFSTAGARQWGMYVGGTGSDSGGGILIDGSNFYITGSTSSSSGIALGTTHQLTRSGTSDAYLMKYFINVGSTVPTKTWGTYFGGVGSEGSIAIAKDASGNLFLSGSTTSTSGIFGGGGFQSTYGGGRNDKFIAKFSPSGTRLWGTYVGGLGDDGDKAKLAVDQNGDVISTGTTNSSSGISYSGVSQKTLYTSNQGIDNGYTEYIVKLHSSGARIWSSYLTNQYGWYSRVAPGFTSSGFNVLNAMTVDNTSIYLGAYNSTGGSPNTYFTTVLKLTNPTPSSLLATEPTAQPTALTFSNVTHNSMTVSYTASADADGYLVVRKTGSFPSGTPVDGVGLQAGNPFGDGTETVVYSGGQLSVDVPGLTNNTTYYYKVFSFKGSGVGINYLSTTPLQGQQATNQFATEPAAPTNWTVTDLTTMNATISYMAPPSQPTGYLLVWAINAVPTFTPSDGNAYGFQMMGNSFIEPVNGTQAIRSGLSDNTTYNYRVFSYNGTGTATNYSATGLSGSFTTLQLATEPSSQPSYVYFPTVDDTYVTVSWDPAPGNPSGYLVLRQTWYNPTDTPPDGYTFNAGEMLASDWVVYSDAGTVFTDYNLQPSTTYFYTVFAYNGSGFYTNYLTTSPITGGVTTLDPYCPNCETERKATTENGTAIFASWSNDNDVKIEFVKPDNVDPRKIYLQRSLDGKAWEITVTTIKEGASDLSTTFDLNVKDKVNNTVQYRLHFYRSKDHFYSNSITLGKTEKDGEEPFVYPNPAKNKIFIANLNPTMLEAYTIKDIQGRQIVVSDKLGKEGDIDVSKLPDGVYLLRVTLKDRGVITSKIIIFH